MMLIKTLILLACTSVALSKHRDKDDSSKNNSVLAKATDVLVFGISIKEFERRRALQQGISGLEWGANGCSRVADRPFGFDFKPACNRHDFAYNNYKKQHRFSSKNKKLIDTKFKNDMFDQCDFGKGPREQCQDMARIYYRGVRIFTRGAAQVGVVKDTAQREDFESDEEGGGDDKEGFSKRV